MSNKTEPMTKQDAMHWLKEAMRTQGEDFIYSDGGLCYYTLRNTGDENDPKRRTGCMVGTAMVLAGREVVERHNALPLNTLGREDLWNLSPDAVEVLYEAQIVQDGGKTWGEALMFAAEKLRKLEENHDCD